MSIVLDKLNELQTKISDKPEPITHIKALYRFAIKDSGQMLDIHIADGEAKISEAGEFNAEPTCTITISEADMVKLLNHELNTTIAYMMGQIKVEGKLGAAMKLLEALSEYK